jgi:hypothetical protein
LIRVDGRLRDAGYQPLSTFINPYQPQKSTFINPKTQQ